MAKSREQKEELLNKYKDILKDNPNYFLVNSDSVSSPEMTELKKALKDSGANFMIVKNTLFRLAAQETNQPNQVQELADSTGVIVCGEDPTEAAKALAEVQKEYKNLDTKFAILFGEAEESDKVKELSEIPSREELLAKLVGSLNSPLSGFVSVAQGNVRQLLTALSEVQKNKE
jgi:large subunit ribosomal protein L10